MTEIVKRTELKLGGLSLNIYAHDSGVIAISFQTYVPYFTSYIQLKKAEARAFAADILACCDALKQPKALTAKVKALSSASDPAAEEIF